MNSVIATSLAAGACALTFTPVFGQTAAAKPLPVPVQVVNGSSQPVPVTLTNPQTVKNQTPAMFRATGGIGTLFTLVPEPAAGTVFVVQSVDVVASASSGTLTSASCTFRLSSNNVAEGVALYGLAAVADGAAWESHHSAYWVLKEHESLVVMCGTVPANASVLAAVGGYSMSTP